MVFIKELMIQEKAQAVASSHCMGDPRGCLTFSKLNDLGFVGAGEGDMEPTGASRSAHPERRRHRRLAPAAHARRSSVTGFHARHFVIYKKRERTSSLREICRSPLSLGVRTHHYENMKTKQLANALIKILGLSVLVQGIPSILAGLLAMLQFGGVGFGSPGPYNYFLHLLPTLIMVAIGIYLIVKSRDVAAFLFRACPKSPDSSG